MKTLVSLGTGYGILANASIVSAGSIPILAIVAIVAIGVYMKVEGY
jgi:hypothetical protein